MKAEKPQLQVIGRREMVAFSEWGLVNIHAKIDTGAYGCAIHCHDFEVVNEGDRELLRFRLLDPSHPEYEDRDYYATEFRDKKVKSSSGQWEHRYTIKTTVKIGRNEYKVEFSLTDRSEMKYPVLLGRKFLKRRFVVDVSKIYLIRTKETPI